MKEETVSKVAELYKLKGEIFSELSKLKDDNNTFEIGYERKGCLSMYGAIKYRTLSSDFLREIKIKVEEYLQQQIEDIDKQLKEL